MQGLKEQALESFRRERYDEAVALMERAAEADPTDAESWYYLGFFNHYRAYDSRPLKGYDFSYSERVFSYLDRALELDPSLGDAAISTEPNVARTRSMRCASAIWSG